MCGGVRGVGAGGIVSSAYCLLFKLFTLKLTERQLVQLINHRDSPYIRGLGFMFIRYCQPPNTFWDWLEPYLEDDEEIDPKAGAWAPKERFHIFLILFHLFLFLYSSILYVLGHKEVNFLFIVYMYRYKCVVFFFLPWYQDIYHYMYIEKEIY